MYNILIVSTPVYRSVRFPAMFPVSPSVTEAIAVLNTPSENKATHSITVTCIILLYDVCVDSGADMCEVMASAVGRITRTGR